jgi:hypothetical protein
MNRVCTRPHLCETGQGGALQRITLLGALKIPSPPATVLSLNRGQSMATCHRMRD